MVPGTGISGTPLSIQGSGFRNGITVTFGGFKAEVLGLSSSLISARAPDAKPGSADVVVTNTDGESATLAGAFTIIPFTVTGIQPQKLYCGGVFFMTGSGLIAGTTVKFDGIPAPFATVTPIGMGGLIPPHGPGPLDITVTSPYGKSLTIPNGFTYGPAPVLIASPETVAVGGTVTVTWFTEETPTLSYIGLFPVGGMEWDEIEAQLVRGNSGSMTFTAPSPPGRYEFRYLPFEGQWGAMAARSNVVTVIPAAQASSRSKR